MHPHVHQAGPIVDRRRWAVRRSDNGPSSRPLVIALEPHADTICALPWLRTGHGGGYWRTLARQNGRSGAAQTAYRLTGTWRQIRRLGARLATAPRLRTVIEISLTKRRREHPHCPVSRLAGSRLRRDADCQMHGDPTYLNAAEADVRRARRRCIIMRTGRAARWIEPEIAGPMAKRRPLAPRTPTRRRSTRPIGA